MSILEYFEIITATPRCSFKTEKMRDKIIEIAKSLSCEVSVDKTGNILCKKGKPNICLQAHYDMVCLGDTKNIELIKEDSILKAKNSTLGADNGMGMAIMLSAMEKYEDIECLFTNDEEVGLIGATNLELQIESSNLLNLDGEEAEEIYIGCAGGIDVVSTLALEYEALGNEKIYEISVKDMPGGHSGVDIDKGIDSAIKVLIRELIEHDIKLLHLQGGEVRNSIPKNASAIIASLEDLCLNNNSLHVKQIDYKKDYIKDGDKILKTLNAFSQGVRGFDKKFDVPSTSINLGLIKTDKGKIQFDCAARSMKNEDLTILGNETKSLFELIGCEVVFSDIYMPWAPQIGNFAKKVQEKMSKVYQNAQFHAIHAGLECGILMQTQKKKIQAVAIGPTIRYPHSLREECDLDSVETIASVVYAIIEGK